MIDPSYRCPKCREEDHARRIAIVAWSAVGLAAVLGALVLITQAVLRWYP